MENGHPVKKQLYPKATEGASLYKSLKTIQDKYDVEFQFCTKDETGFKIIELLERG
jgi:ribosome-associated protein